MRNHKMMKEEILLIIEILSKKPTNYLKTLSKSLVLGLLDNIKGKNSFYFRSCLYCFNLNKRVNWKNIKKRKAIIPMK